MIKGFFAFLMRGNVIELAVAVVVGGAFSAVVNAIVKDLLTPLIAAIAGKPDFGALAFTLNNSTFRYGDFLNAVVAFVSIAACIYYFVVLPSDVLTKRLKRSSDAPANKTCGECLSEIAIDARRCKFCTQPA